MADLSEYQNREVLVMYQDGSVEVVSFDTDAALREGLTELSKDDTVLLYQPNYSYSSAAEPYQDEQWGMENDGTFYMEERSNAFPVYDQPFEEAKKPWSWYPYGDADEVYGMNQTFGSRTVTATENIDINLSEALSLYHDSGREVIVAMVDTGIDDTHEELAGRIWINEDEIPENGIDDDGNGYVDDVNGWNFYYNSPQIFTGSEDDHGTHGAGTIVAKENNKGIIGINQSEHVKVMSVKALGGQYGDGSTESLIQAIRYAEQNGADICNLSLGTGQNDQALYYTMANSDMLFVVSAGNDGTNIDLRPSYPASYDLDNIISVANLNCDGTLNQSSNYGVTSVDLAAPGSYILSTTINNGYSYMSGTSMSAPFVSAAAAMIFSHFGDVSASNVKKIILSTVTPLDSLSGVAATGGMLNLGAALAVSPDDLPEEEEQELTSAEKTGTVPVLKGYLTESFIGTLLVLQVYDADNDVVSVSYVSGTQPVQFFGCGNGEREISLNRNGTAVFVASPGTYTFCAADAGGNKTVLTVTLQKQAQNPIYRDFFGTFRW